MRIDGEPAFVLHTRDYRETSQLVDIFSRHYGRLRLVAKGSRGKSLKKTSKHLMPFTPLQIGWTGKGDLKNLLNAEISRSFSMLTGERLYSGFYLNELLIRVLPEFDPHEGLFDDYQQVIFQLSQDECLEAQLRSFEISLLEAMGYELVLNIDIHSGEPVRTDAWYWYDPLQGVTEGFPDRQNQRGDAWFSGEKLLAIADQEFSHPSVLREAKRLLRLALKPHLGNKPLQSRALFIT